MKSLALSERIILILKHFIVPDTFLMNFFLVFYVDLTFCYKKH